MEDLAKNQHFEWIAKKGAAIYEQVRKDYEPKYKGKYLAIEAGSGKIYMGNSTNEAVSLAKAEYPNTIFYLVIIGLDGDAMLRRSMVGYYD